MAWIMGLLRFLAGLAMLPLCVAATRTLIALTVAIKPSSAATIPPAAWALAAGLLLWLFLYAVLPKPFRTYVLAHELTHALWGSVMGARVSNLRVSRQKGSVMLSKTNVLITLAPYFFPLYTVLIVVGYYALAVFVDVERYDLLWLGLVSFTWGFHATFTFSALMQRQTDIQEYGRLFSYVVIYLMNVLGICLWIVIVSPVTLEQMFRTLQTDVFTCLHGLWQGAAHLADRSGAINGFVRRYLK